MKLKKEPTDLFEMMVTDDLVEQITQPINLYFKQNLVGKVFLNIPVLKNTCYKIIKTIYFHVIPLKFVVVLLQLCIEVFVLYKILFETQGFRKILTQNKLVLIERYL